MRKYLIGKADVWLRSAPQPLKKCWRESNEHSIYDIEIILVYEGNTLVKSLSPEPFVESWLSSPKDYDKDVYPQFLAHLSQYIESNT
jgi:hypothetical protein